MKFEIISGYKFIDLTDLYGLQSRLKKQCVSLNILGTILLSTEGINVMLAGDIKDIAAFEAWLKGDARLEDLWFKHSSSQIKPFSHLKVRIKPEIITMCVPGIRPADKPAKVITPLELKAWYDTGKDFIILDTRNACELEWGRFKNARSVHVESFSQYKSALSVFTVEEMKKPIVTYCTGGVRCEKAALLMEALQFSDVYQLKGGILHYFEECGGAHWEGSCFVFDNRIAIDSLLCEVNRGVQCEL